MKRKEVLKFVQKIQMKYSGKCYVSVAVTSRYADISFLNKDGLCDNVFIIFEIEENYREKVYECIKRIGL